MEFNILHLPLRKSGVEFRILKIRKVVNSVCTFDRH